MGMDFFYDIHIHSVHSPSTRRPCLSPDNPAVFHWDRLIDPPKLLYRQIIRFSSHTGRFNANRYPESRLQPVSCNGGIPAKASSPAQNPGIEASAGVLQWRHSG
jgi:hypothetical protein